MRRLVSLLLSFLLIGSLTACAGRVPSDDGRLQVVCTLFPYYDFVRAIGGEHVSPRLLVAAGREVHSFEPTPLDVVDVSRADVFVYNGGEGELWVEDILSAAGDKIGCVLRMMDYAEGLEEEFVEGMEGAEEEEEEDHDLITYDEHIWTSPVQAMALCRAVCDALCAADPAHQADYRANLTAYLEELAKLDAAFRQVVKDGKRDLLIFGDRFPLLYFCHEYGLNYRAAFHGCSGDTEPSLTTLKYLIDRIRAEQIPVVYTMELSNRKIAAAIAETTGARVVTFQSCQSVSRADFEGGRTYIDLMWDNVSALKEGLA